MRANLRLALTALLALLALFAAGPVLSPAYAQQKNEGGISISVAQSNDPAVTSKGYFIFKAKPGDVVTGKVLVQNTATVTNTAILGALDAITAQGGSSAFPASDVAPTGPGTWLELSTKSVTIPPQRAMEVPFTVRVPASVQPRQYLAGIVAYSPKTSTADTTAVNGNQAGASVQVQTRYVIGVEVDVPGAWNPDMVISGAEVKESADLKYIDFTLKNTGDTFIRPAGIVTISGVQGSGTVTQAVSLGTFITGSDTDYQITLSKNTEPGTYKVNMKLNYGDADKEGGSKVAVYDGTVQVSPPAKQQAQAASGDQAPSELQLTGGGSQSSGNSGGAAPAGVSAATGTGDSGVPPWMVYGIVVLLVAILALLALNLVRHRTEKGGRV